MSRISNTFHALKAAGRTALIPYVTAGDPDPTVTVPLMHSMVEAGANLIELGVPFSDPMADGPAIQAACERALVHNTSLHDVLDMVRAFRQQDQDTPVVLMGYLNPLEAMGYESFAREAAGAGVDGVLTVDMPPEESHDLARALDAHGLDPIYLLAPTTTAERMARITSAGRGFVYYVSLKGVTGAASLDVASVSAKVEQIRSMSDLPIGVGFGIHDADSAARVGAVADAVIVGSALVRKIAANTGEPDKIKQEIADTLSSMRRALDRMASDS
jgi:tryptophan synthase alpha chain